MKKVLLILFLSAFSLFCFSQAKQNKYEDETFQGGITDPKGNYFPPNPSVRVPIHTLLKYDNRDLMAGNECVREETIKMGFEYLVLCNPKVTIWNRVWVFFYNFSSNTELTFRNGFGWQGRLKKRIKECKQSSGDFVW